MKKAIYALLLAFLPSLAWGQESQTEYNFLRLPVSAHAAALGGENITIIEDDPSLVFSNPALAASVSDRTAGLNYMNYMSGVSYASASYTKVLAPKATVVGGVKYINYGSMKETDATGTQVGTFSANEFAIEGTLAYQLARNVVGGITAKYVYSHIADYSSMGVAVDLGLNWYMPEREWSISVVAKNLGGEVKAYNDDFGKMPFDLQLGVSKTFQGLPVRVSATLIDMTHYDYRFANHLCLGADILFSESIWAGLGYNFRRAEEMKTGEGDEESAHGAGLSFGAGLNQERFRLNVAYGKYHVSSHSLILNVGYTF